MFEAVFIDRDGTIGGSDQVEYPGKFELFPGVQEAINRLKSAGKLIVSFTNQPGISVGEATREMFEKELESFGFDNVYLCPHQHFEQCQCRKPATGMLFKSATENNLNLEKCVVIGDRWTDMLAAERTGSKKIIVKTGAGTESILKYQNQTYFGEWAEVNPDFIAEDFQQAVDWVLNNERTEYNR